MREGDNRLFYPTGDRATSMLLLERNAPAQARLGKPYNYQLVVTNLTNTPLQGVVVSEMLPGLSAVNEQNGNAAKPASPIAQRSHTIGELKPKESRTLNLSGMPAKEGSISSCTSVSCNPTLCMATTVINPAMQIMKEAIGSGDLCEPQTIRYTIKNTGSGDLSGVRIDDQLPDGLAMNDQTAASRVALKVGTIAQGQSKTVDVKVKAAGAGKFASAATATADDDVTAKSEPLAMTIKAPQLEVTLKAPEKEYLGQQVKYEVTVKNVGTAIARNPKVRIDSASDVAEGARKTEAELAAARDAIQPVGEIEPGQSKTVTLPYKPRAEGDLRVNATATDPCAKTATATGLTKIAALPALLLSAVDDHDPVRVGENVTYTITVLNQGFGGDKNIRVIATLPEGEEYVSSEGSSKGTLDGQKLTFAPVENIAAKQTLTWTLTVKAAKAADVRMKVEMSSDSFHDAAVKVEPTRLY